MNRRVTHTPPDSSPTSVSTTCGPAHARTPVLGCSRWILFILPRSCLHINHRSSARQKAESYGALIGTVCCLTCFSRPGPLKMQHPSIWHLPVSLNFQRPWLSSRDLHSLSLAPPPPPVPFLTHRAGPLLPTRFFGTQELGPSLPSRLHGKLSSTTWPKSLGFTACPPVTSSQASLHLQLSSFST